MNIFKKTIRILSGVVFVAATIGLVLCCCSSDKLEINKYNYKNNKIADGKTFNAAVITDYHHRDLKFSNTDMLTAIKSLDDMDAIFITGDLIDAHVKNLDDTNKILEESTKKAKKVYFVTGNHEEYAPLWPQLRESLNKYNVTYFDNQKDILTFADKNVCIYGLMDPRFDLHSYKTGRIDYGKSEEYLNNLKPSETKDKINILLAHRPEAVDLYARYDFDYIICGHSHGGQIKIGNWTPLDLAFHGKNYSRGEYKINNSTMLISAGLGHSAMFPLRINCNPEIITISISK